jgi:HEAT repeat protein
MSLLNLIQTSDQQPKSLAESISLAFLQDPQLLTELAAALEAGNKVEKGILLEAVEFATKTSPSLVNSYIDLIARYLDDPAPKVKWEAARVIANIAATFSTKVTVAIPQLLLNTKDPGTVVRWSAAYALCEIAKHNLKVRPDLMNHFSHIIKTEQNSGVRNVYIKSVKEINNSIKQ